ncbi:MAG: diguanylate cyclase, partial [Gammaproteobacteria bacterium]|nr:diguanylate cyclase [Gammaproteobacteria bacterium]
ILIVDDDEGTRRSLALVFRKKGYQVETAATALEALSKTKVRSFNIALVDISLPDLEGIDLVVPLKKRQPDIDVIMVTGHASLETAIGAINREALAYITKPLDLDQVLAKVDGALEKQRLIMENRRLYRVAQRELQEHKQAEEALRKSEERYRALYDDNPSMYFTLDADGTVLSINHFGAEQLGYAVGELLGRSIRVVLHEEDRTIIKKRLETCLAQSNQLHQWEIRKVRKDGSLLWVRQSARAIERNEGQPVILIVCEDITEAHQLSEELSHQASHDVLTGLANRTVFERRLKRMLQTARDQKTEHALCYLDLDQFKAINDTCGHAVGDELLRQLGEVLEKTVRKRDTLARLGGDEFGVLMEHCSLKQAARVANAFQKAIRGFQFVWEDKSFGISVSIGLVPINDTSESITSVLQMADSACYAAKDAGRNRIFICHDDADPKLARRHGAV